MPDLLSEIAFLFPRLTWSCVLDLVLVTLIIFTLLVMVRETQAVVLLRGVILIIIFLSLLTSLVDLPAFSWLIHTTLPALLLAIPVIFAPEIRRGLERLGRAGSAPIAQPPPGHAEMDEVIRAVVTASARLSSREHGALIVLQRSDNLDDYIRTGVRLNARVTPELLLQIFYPNTPLHDGAVIITGDAWPPRRASCRCLPAASSTARPTGRWACATAPPWASPKPATRSPWWSPKRPARSPSRTTGA